MSERYKAEHPGIVRGLLNNWFGKKPLPYSDKEYVQHALLIKQAAQANPKNQNKIVDHQATKIINVEIKKAEAIKNEQLAQAAAANQTTTSATTSDNPISTTTNTTTSSPITSSTEQSKTSTTSSPVNSSSTPVDTQPIHIPQDDTSTQTTTTNSNTTHPINPVATSSASTNS